MGPNPKLTCVLCGQEVTPRSVMPWVVGADDGVSTAHRDCVYLEATLRAIRAAVAEDAALSQAWAFIASVALGMSA